MPITTYTDDTNSKRYEINIWHNMLFNLKLIPCRYTLNTLILSAAYAIGVIVFNLKLQINIAVVSFMQESFHSE